MDAVRCPQLLSRLLKKCRPIDLGWSLGDLEPLRRIQSGCQLAMCVFESMLALDSQRSLVVSFHAHRNLRFIKLESRMESCSKEAEKQQQKVAAGRKNGAYKLYTKKETS